MKAMKTDSNTPITPFLRQVAQYYITKAPDQLHSHCFVFPNRRSGQFFLKEISEAVPDGQIVIAPHVTTITDFVSEITNQIPASQVESLFILYRCYQRISGLAEADNPFDKFIFWGNVVINDFNEVDKYLIEPKKIFQNIENYREIGTDYIPDEVKDIMARYLNIDFGNANDKERFWRHLHGNDGEITNRYVQLWNSMFLLYQEFRHNLKEMGLSYEGKIFRDAVDKIRNTAVEDFKHSRFVFVGFNFLTKAEEKIFSLLANKKIADFFWDDASPAFADKTNCGATHLKANKAKFPHPQDFLPEEIHGSPTIHSFAVPSNTGQALFVANMLREQRIPYSSEEPSTAIVLPDENLLLPLINSLPQELSSVNVTMGYPLRNSEIMTLFRTVARMHAHARLKGESWTFFRDFVKDTLSHPIIKSIYPRQANEIINYIDDNFIFDVPAELFGKYPFECLFRIIGNGGMLHDSLNLIEALTDFSNDIKQGMLENSAPKVPLQCAFIDQFIDLLAQLHSIVERFQIKMNEDTIFNLIERLAAVVSIPFEGEPLQGLQIMGTLETQSLDFENLVILSVNERVFPHKNAFKPSFIPNIIRRGNQLPTVEAQEETSTYYFYRMICRAQNVWLFYNSSTQAYGTSEKSRFIEQLKRIYNVSVTAHEVQLKQTPADKYSIEINSNNDAAQYFNTDNDLQNIKSATELQASGIKCLSASSINHYIGCPLQFFLQHICHFRNDNPPSDFMDAGQFGSIVHDTLQELYWDNSKDHKITIAKIRNFEKNFLDDTLKRNINKTFLKRTNLDDELTGQATIVFGALRHYIKAALDEDIKTLNKEGGEQAFIQVLECEEPHYLHLAISKDCSINFHFRADRIDRINGVKPVRIIDYKTGSDETSFKSIEQLFDVNTNRRKAILQLFLYSNAYLQLNPECEAVQPMIFSLKKKKFEVYNLSDKKQVKITKDDDLNQEFLDNMGKHLKQMRDADFHQTKDKKEKLCKYCRFAEICHK